MKDNLYKSLINGDGMEKRASENNFLAAFSDGELQKLAEELAATISEEDKENKKKQNEDANENAATSGADAKDVSDITGDNAEALAQKAKAQIEARKEPVAESLPDTERTASVEEIEEIIKEAAYAMTEEVLGSMGISARDYIMAKVADEDVADSIEKRASVVSEISGTTVLRAADDLLSEITARLSDNQ